MFLRVSTFLLAIAALSGADTLTLRSGQVVRGEYLGGDARHIKMAVDDRVETYSVEDVADLSFGGGQRTSSDDDRRDNADRRDNGLARCSSRGPASGARACNHRNGDPRRYLHYRPHDRCGEFASKPDWAKLSAPAWMNP